MRSLVGWRSNRLRKRIAANITKLHCASRQILTANVPFGSKADIGGGLGMSALRPKADIQRYDWDVRLVPKADQVHRNKGYRWSITSSAVECSDVGQFDGARAAARRHPARTAHVQRRCRDRPASLRGSDPNQQREAFARKAAGEALVDIARSYALSHSTISRLRAEA